MQQLTASLTGRNRFYILIFFITIKYISACADIY